MERFSVPPADEEGAYIKVPECEALFTLFQ
jgi:hypothetical protein